MCGIFGIITGQKCKLQFDRYSEILNTLFILSQSRGKEAAGLALENGCNIEVLKSPMSASKFIKTKKYNSLINRINLDKSCKVIGHSRLVTNGSQYISENNQPVLKGGTVAVHNGIIVNDNYLWSHFSELEREYQVDTEIILSLFEKKLKESNDVRSSIKFVYDNIYGTAAIAMLSNYFDDVIIATNNGSLYYTYCKEYNVKIFASEKYILKEFNNKFLKYKLFFDSIVPVNPGQMVFIQTDNKEISVSDYTMLHKEIKSPLYLNRNYGSIEDLTKNDNPEKANLLRCKKCILPETMPFISFDQNGVCNYCNNYVKIQINNRTELTKQIEKHRKLNHQPEALLGISGGRDSCYGLHLVVNELNLKPIAYTYDWGLVTDLARRNVARLCGSLGIEHILVSADISQKRKYVRKNVIAWLKKPELGMVPLFMAGDKAYFYYAEKICKENDLDLSILCENKLERAHFKTGFTGINNTDRVFNIGIKKKMMLASYYFRQYLMNLRYFNESLKDNIFAFYSSYFLKHDQNIQLYEYFPWKEEEVINTLISQYSWELASDTKSTWRIGDGTAAFYNYIYYTIAGFTEIDCMRSNQIREGMLSRENALKMIKIENQPRWDSLEWYARIIGFDLNDAIRIINTAKKLYSNKN